MTTVEKPFEELFGASRFAIKRIEVYKCLSTNTPSGIAAIEKAIQGSTIVTEEDCQYLAEILEDISNFTLLFRSKDVAYTSQLFHEACDKQGPTIVLIRVNDQVGGGFTDMDWDSVGGYKRSEKSFIFSLTKKRIFFTRPTL